MDTLPDFIWIEIGREAATMIMLASVGFLAARTWPGRLGAFALAMGLWDIFYYVFLWLFAGWPASLFDQDVLFLIPLPWWGPVLAPVSIALLIPLRICSASGVTGGVSTFSLGTLIDTSTGFLLPGLR